MKTSALALACGMALLACEGEPAEAPRSSNVESGERASASALLLPYSRLLGTTPLFNEPLLLTRGGLSFQTAGVGRKLQARLPSRSDLPLVIERTDSDFGVSALAIGSNSVPGVVGQSLVSFAGGGPRGTDVLFVAQPDAVEDLVRITAPGENRLRYMVDVSRVSGLRLVGDTLEFQDASGSPRFRISPPYLVDDEGVSRTAHLSVQNCRYDESPRLPWGRPITPPGAPTCVVSVSWEDSGLRYPLIVDPLWTIGDSLAVARFHHTANLIPADKQAGVRERVCVVGGTVGGEKDKRVPIASTECFDVEHGVWAAVQPLVQARYRHTATTLLDGSVLVVGGDGDAGPIASTEQLNPATGTWRAGPALPGLPRSLHSATLLNDGSVVVIGGGSLVPLILERPHLSIESWLQSPVQMSAPRFGHAAVLAAGRIFVFGGSATRFVEANPVRLDAVESYDPSSGAENWRLEKAMSGGRVGHTATLLPAVSSSLHPQSELIVVAGGDVDASTPDTVGLPTLLFDPRSRNWQPPKRQTSWLRTNHAAIQMQSAVGDAYVMIVGGSLNALPYPDGEVFSRNSNAWAELDATLTNQREEHTATVLQDERTVLVTGGRSLTNPLRQTELLTLAQPGEKCSSTANCLVGVCSPSKGVCCDDVCGGGCEACTVDAGAAEDGKCAILAKKTTCGTAPQSCELATTCDGHGPECPSKQRLMNGESCDAGIESGSCTANGCATQSDGTAGAADDENAGSNPGGNDSGGMANAGMGGARTGGASATDDPAIRFTCQSSPGKSAKSDLSLLFVALLVGAQRFCSRSNRAS